MNKSEYDNLIYFSLEEYKNLNNTLLEFEAIDDAKLNFHIIKEAAAEDDDASQTI